MYVCLCKGLTEADVRRVAVNGVSCPNDLIAALRLDDDDCCGRCAKNVDDLMTIASCPTPRGLRQRA